MGKPRGGKTLTLVSTGLDIFKEIKFQELYLKEKEKIKKLSKSEKQRLKIFSKFELWSNLNLNKKIFGNYRYISLKDIMKIYQEKIEIKYKLIVIDDLFKEINYQEFGKEINIAMSYFVTEVGKKKNILLYVSHFKRRVDINLRTMTELFVLCQKGKYLKIKLSKGFFNLWIEDKNYYELITEDKILKQMVIKNTYCTHYIDFMKDYHSELKTDKILYISAYEIFKLYDTEEVI